MLTFQEKLSIIKSFNELTRHDVSLSRVNFQFEESAYEKKNVVYHLHPNGNGYVYAELIPNYVTDKKGMVNIRDFSKEELQTIIQQSIESLKSKELGDGVGTVEERWVNKDNHLLILINEDDMWNVYAGLNLDGTFTTYKEARQYLMEEGFKEENPISS